MNHADLSPNYSGFLMSVTNTVASLPGFLAPLLTGVITQGNVRVAVKSNVIFSPILIPLTSSLQSTIAAWRIIFLIAASFYIIPAITFIIYGKAEVQKYDAYANEKLPEKKPEDMK